MLVGDSVKKIFISGGAGFIGSHLVDILVPQGYHVTVYDNLCNGQRSFIEQHMGASNFEFIEADMCDLPRVIEAVRGHDLVWHLASNTDIIGCHDQPERDLNDCIIATFNVLEAMRQTGVRDIMFSSSGAVYGKLCHDTFVDESCGPLLAGSGYAAGKIAGEALISSFCHMYGLRGWIFRFGNVLGARMTHGVIYDFIHKLKKNPAELEVLGNGQQEKNYFLVDECIDGMAYGYRHVAMTEDRPCDIFNLGTDSVTRVTDIAEIVRTEMGLKDAKISIAGTDRAWPGDQTKVHFTIDKYKAEGWTAKRSSDEAVRIAVRRMTGKEDA